MNRMRRRMTAAEDQRELALAELLGLDPSQIKNDYGNIYTATDDEGYEEEYLVLSGEAEADRYALQDVLDCLDEFEYVDECVVCDLEPFIRKDELDAERKDYYGRECDELANSADSEFGSGLVAEAYYRGLLDDDKDFDVDDNGDAIHSECLLDDDEIKDMMVKHRMESEDCLDYALIEKNETGGKFDGVYRGERGRLKNVPKSCVDLDKLARYCVDVDGRGHFLSSYDGEEIKYSYKGTDYYIYRTN